MVVFNSQELLAPYPSPKLEDHSLLSAHDCLFNIRVFANLPYLEAVPLHLQPEEMPCHSDKGHTYNDPENFTIIKSFIQCRITLKGHAEDEKKCGTLCCIHLMFSYRS
jgi:hypothetical protein